MTRGEVGVELEDQHRVGAGGADSRSRCSSVVRRNQRRFGRKIAHRMRIEGRDQRRPALDAGAIDGAADHRLVAEVKSVEIAERDDAAAKMGRNRRAPIQALHRDGYRVRAEAADNGPAAGKGGLVHARLAEGGKTPIWGSGTSDCHAISRGILETTLSREDEA